MKRTCFILLLSVFVSALWAQVDSLSNEKNGAADSLTVNLDEVTVKAERVIKTADGLKIFPSAVQIEASADGFGLLQRLALPQVKVDELRQTITTAELLGAVQVRINDIVATSREIAALELSAVRSVDFIQHPGLRYGEGVGLVINIHTRRAESGYVAGGSVTQGLTALFNNSSAYAKANRGRHELAVEYGFNVADYKGNTSAENANYHLGDGSVFHVERRDLTDKGIAMRHDFSLKYSLAEPEKYTLQVALSDALSNSPDHSQTRTETSALWQRTIGISSSQRSQMPQLDVYFNWNLPRRQTITANVVGSLLKDKYSYGYGSFEDASSLNPNAASPYSYDVHSRQKSFAGEAIYEKKWNPCALSVGGKFNALQSTDDYAGDIATTNRLRRSDLYLYSQLAGQMGRFSYKIGLGFDRLEYRQNEKQYAFNNLIPKLSLTYSPWDKLSLMYSFTQEHRPPRLALINDVTTKLNDLEFRVGNPDIVPCRRQEHTLTANLFTRRVENSLTALYRTNTNTWMNEITRTDDNLFLWKKANSGDINMLYISNYATLHVIPQKLDIMLQGSFLRAFNFGETYTHCYSGWMFGGDIQAYLGRLTVTAHYDNGWKSLEDETRMHNNGATYLALAYPLGRWGRLTAFWQHPFDNDVTTSRTWLLNRYVQKTTIATDATMGNLVCLRLTVNLSRGRRYQSAQKTLDNRDVESSAVRVKES